MMPLGGREIFPVWQGGRSLIFPGPFDSLSCILILNREMSGPLGQNGFLD
jgi:hypothetical protein